MRRYQTFFRKEKKIATKKTKTKEKRKRKNQNEKSQRKKRETRFGEIEKVNCKRNWVQFPWIISFLSSAFLFSEVFFGCSDLSLQKDENQSVTPLIGYSFSARTEDLFLFLVHLLSVFYCLACPLSVPVRSRLFFLTPFCLISFIQNSKKHTWSEWIRSFCTISRLSRFSLFS